MSDYLISIILVCFMWFNMGALAAIEYFPLEKTK